MDGVSWDRAKKTKSNFISFCVVSMGEYLACNDWL